MRPETSGVYALNPSFRRAPALRHVTSLPQLLAANGYRTYSTGKNYHGNRSVQEAELPAEFTEWGYQPTGGLRPPQKLRDGINPHPLIDWGVFPPNDEDQQDWMVADWAIKKLEENSP